MPRILFPCPLTDEPCSLPECSRNHCHRYKTVSGKEERVELDRLLKLPSTPERTTRILELLGL